jgi:hypothetical protein
MALSKTKLSTRRLSEVARHVVIPEGIVTTGWPAVERKCLEFGDRFDQWQSDAGRVILGKRADGSYAATIGGITLSIPRQVAKTFLVGRIIFALCLVFPGLKVLWTAHRTRTATNTFKSLQGYARRKLVAPSIAAIRTTNGEQEILFTNGSVIMFGAREQGFGRGFDEVDVEVFDEAQILTEKALEDMVAATNQSRHPHGALLFFMGTPPRPVDPGEAFTIRRDEALAHKPEVDDFGGEPVIGDDAVYLECSADRDADSDDHSQWAKANPSFPYRTPLRSMLRLRKNLPSEDSWRREGLGIWDSKGVIGRVFNLDRWGGLTVDTAPPTGSVSYGVKFSPDGMTVALSVGVRPANGPVHVEGVDHRPTVDGTRWLVDWLAARWKGASIVIDGKAGAGALVKALERSKVPTRRIKKITTDEVVSANSMFLTAVAEGTVSHIDDEALEHSLRSAGRRPIGKAGGWGLQSIDDGDVTLIESTVLAHWGASTAPMVEAKPKVVVLT